ncbi:unnamed protein product [Brassica rapa subsp. narinosa]
MSDFNFCKMIKANYYSYSGWWSVWWSGTYSMILSKAAFFHKKKVPQPLHKRHAGIYQRVHNQ